MTMTERRMHKRFLVTDNIYVYRSKRVGKIRNASEGGLLCTCLGEKQCNSANFDIFCPGSNICLGAMPFKVVKSKNIYVTGSSSAEGRKCHIKFDDLPVEKISELNDFLTKYSIAIL